MDAAQLYDNSSELQENFDPAVSIGEVSVEPPSEHLKFAIELPQRLKYDCGSPECDATPRCSPQIDCISELAGVSQKSSPECNVHPQEIYHSEKKKEASDCDWESLTSDATDLLIFSSPIGTNVFKGLMQKSVDLGASFSTSLDDVHKVQIDPVDSGDQQEIEYPSTQPGETIVPKEIIQIQDNLAANNNPNKCMTSNPSDEVENDVGMSSRVVSKVKNSACFNCEIHGYGPNFGLVFKF